MLTRGLAAGRGWRQGSARPLLDCAARLLAALGLLVAQNG